MSFAETFKPGIVARSGRLPKVTLGDVVSRHSAGPDGIPYFIYAPRTASASAPLFVSVHGIARNAAEHAIRFRPIADRYGAILVAPLLVRLQHRRAPLGP